MGINNLFVKLDYIIKYIVYEYYFIKKTKKIVILILFNINDHIKSKNKNYTSYC